MNLTDVVIGKSPVYFHAKYGRTNSGAEKRIQVQAITKDVPTIPTSLNEQSVTTIPAEHAYPVQNCSPPFERQPAFTPREVSDSTLSLLNPVHITPVQYSAWQMLIPHHSTQIMTGFSTGGTLQGSSVPSINNIYSGFCTDPTMGQQPFAQVPPFQSS
jgi:hypothetical protein